MVGGIVRHPKHGRGKVLKEQNSGYRLYVEFDSGTITWVRGDEVETDRIVNQRTFDKKEIDQKINNPSFFNRRIIEAFRLGIVPYDRVEKFTFGRDNEIDDLLEWLKRDEVGTNIILGQYGSGKTHLAHYLYWRALKEGYAVANVELDPTEIPLNNPKKVYNRLVHNFRFMHDGKLKSFRDFVRSALNQGALNDHLYFKHMKICDRNNDILWDWIEGAGQASRPMKLNRDKNYAQLPPMPSVGTAANIYCNLVSSISWTAKNYFGLKGFLIICDEAEVIDMTRYGYQLNNAKNFISSLVRLSNNDSELLLSPESTGLGYLRNGPSVPFMYKNSPNLKVAFVFTPNEALDKIDCLKETCKLQLQPIGEEGLEEVLKNVRSVYNSAYPTFKCSLTTEQGMDLLLAHTEKTRFFVKGAVELLDTLRLGTDLEKAEIFE